jgi:gliding motility-associated-like protein
LVGIITDKCNNPVALAAYPFIIAVSTNAGMDINTCSINNIMNATAAPSTFIGTWTQVSGPGTTVFSNVNSPTATATASVQGVYVYNWQISNGLGCVINDLVTETITIPTFTTVAPICIGGAISSLPTTSLNGISGTWSPAINNLATTTYTFTPTVFTCAPVTLTIIVNPLAEPTFAPVASICTGGVLAPLPTASTNATPINGTWSPALNNLVTTTYIFTPTAGQCADTTTKTIFVFPPLTPTFSSIPSICAGDALAALPIISNNGVTGTWLPALSNIVTTTYTFTPTSTLCNSTTILNIIVMPEPTATVSAHVCSNNLPYIWNGLNLNTTGTYTNTQLASNGCDSTTTMNFTVSPALSSLIAITACPSSLPYSWNGQSLTVGGTYTNTQISSNGCDSTTTLNFTVSAISVVNQVVSACSNSLPYVWNGLNIIANGIYSDTSISSTGCDSVINLNFTITPLSTATITASACNNSLPYFWNGQNLNTAGTYTNTQIGSNGCDSTTTLNFTINPLSTATVTATACANNLPYVWNGQNINSSGTFSNTQIGSNGCDSNTTLNFTVVPLSTVTVTATACANNLPYVWNGQSINTAGSYSNTQLGLNGCDSTTTLNFTITPLSTSTVTAISCINNLPYGWNGQNLMSSGIYTNTQLGSNGCDSTTSIFFTVTPISTTTVTANACSNNLPYLWNGQNLISSGVYTNSQLGSNGCDSTTTMNFTVTPVSNISSAVTVCANNLPYVWNGQSLNSTGIYSNTQVGTNGCDSTTTLNFTVSPITVATVTISTCSNNLPFLWNGQNLNASGTYSNTQMGSNGCDSITTNNFTVSPTTTALISITSCPSALPFSWNGQSLTIGGTYTNTQIGSNGCDSTTTLNFTVAAISVVNQVASACANSLPYLWNSFNIMSSGIYSDTSISSSGCDSVTILNFSLIPLTITNLSISECANNLPYVWNGQNLNTNGTYANTQTGSNGCDSSTILTFIITPNILDTIFVSTCTSSLPYIWNGQTLSSTGVYSNISIGSNGCDSTTTLNFTVTAITIVNQNASTCSNNLPYVWNGINILASGIYSDTSISSTGCDSVTLLNFTVLPLSTATVTATACSNNLPYVWNGQNLTTNGTYTNTQLGSNGCDSTTTMNFTVTALTTATVTATACANNLPYVWNGQNLTTNGTYSNTQMGSNGCDSTTTMNFTLIPITTATITATACSNNLPYVWNGQNLSASGTYTNTQLGSNGCDSTTTLNFTITPTTTVVIAISSCPSGLPYAWNGQSLTMAGTYSNTQLGSNGCDSTTTLNFTVTTITIVNQNASTCNNNLPYVWNGINILASGIYSDTSISSTGCDSVTILNFTVLPLSIATVTATACSNNLPYVWNGQNLTTNGTYSNTQMGSNGCDSTTTMTFTVTALTTATVTATACANNLPYVWNGQNLITNGTYSNTQMGSNGCDSSTTMNFTVIPITTATITATACSNNLPYVWNGQNLSASGTYTNTQLGSNGCDSTTTLNFTAMSIDTSTLLVIVCANNLPYLWNGQLLNITGIYTNTQAGTNGCDSIGLLNLTVTPIITPTFTSNSGYCIGALIPPLPTTSNNGINGTWLPAINNLSTTTYTFTPVAGSCANVATLTLIVSTPTAFVTSVTDASCGNANGVISIGAITGGTAPFTYNLNNQGFAANTVYNNLISGSYTIVAMDVNGCTTSAMVNIGGTPAVADFTIIKVDATCNDSNGEIHISNIMGGVSPFTVRINNLNVSTALDYYNLIGGNYTIEVIDANGCILSKVITINSSPDINDILVSSNTASCGNANGFINLVAIDGGTLPITYSILPSGITNSSGSFQGLNGGENYTITATDSKGCTNTTTSFVADIPCCATAFIPSAFSPNSDGFNDIFKPVLPDNLELREFIIKNRYGQNVFSTTNKSIGWTGVYNGKDADLDVYFYYLRYYCPIDNIEYIMKGDVTLIR